MLRDTQSVKNAATATPTTVGVDAGNLVKGRQALVRLDTRGNGRASRVGPAHLSDAAAAIACWDEVAAPHPPLGRGHGGLGDRSFAGRFAGHLAPDDDDGRCEKPAHLVLKKKSFCLATKRWLVERPLAWLNANRRLAKEEDRLLPRANAWIGWANGRRILIGC